MTTKTERARCDGEACAEFLPVEQLETVGRLRFCPPCATWERRYRATEGEQRRATLVAAVLEPVREARYEALRRGRPCTAACRCCQRRIPARGQFREGGKIYAHTGVPAA